jgi:DNA (cytosine-5)-methyltransferase 1
LQQKISLQLTFFLVVNIADYDCVQPANGYKRLYSLFFEKANACVQVYQTLSNTSGGDPNLTLNELLARVFRSMSTSKTLPLEFPIREFIVSKGEFIYNQLIGLDGAPEKNERTFRDMPVLTALKDESKKQGYSVPPKEDGNMKLARLMLEEENWQSQQRKSRHRAGASSSNFSFKINEDEIANDYPLPAYYNTCIQETDEYIIFGFDVDGCDSSELPQAMLHNWSLYNSDSRLISLELLPMNPCANIDVTIFGSGIMRDDDGSGYFLDDDIQSSSSPGGVDTVDGMPIYLSAIKEWKIEFGSSMVSISIRTDMAWY